MEIKLVADNIKNGLNKADTIIECDEVRITDTDRIYISFTENLDAHGVKTQDLIRLDCSLEEYVFSKQSDEIKTFVRLEISPSEAANVC